MGNATRLVRPRSVVGDGAGLVSRGGLVCLAETADLCGLSAGLSTRCSARLGVAITRGACCVRRCWRRGRLDGIVGCGGVAGSTGDLHSGRLGCDVVADIGYGRSRGVRWDRHNARRGHVSDMGGGCESGR